MDLGAVGRYLREVAVMIGHRENVSTAHREQVPIYLNFPSPERNTEIRGGGRMGPLTLRRGKRGNATQPGVPGMSRPSPESCQVNERRFIYHFIVHTMSPLLVMARW